MITQFPDFKPLELFDKKYIETFTVQFPPYSDFNFTSIWAWNTNDKFQISNLNGNLVVLFYDYVSNNPFFSFIGSNKIEDTAARILEYSINKYGVAYLKLIPEHIINHFQNNHWNVLPDTNSDDYILSVDFLKDMDKLKKSSLSNAIRKFIKTNEKYLVKFNSIREVDNKIYFKFIEDWSNNKELSGGIINERIALKKYFDLQGCETKIFSLFVNGKLVAFDTCEFCSKDYAIIHFGKTDYAYSGAAEILSWEEAKYLSNLGLKLINIEQDLGISGLRYSKQKFKPSHFLKKYILQKSTSPST